MKKLTIFIIVLILSVILIILTSCEKEYEPIEEEQTAHTVRYWCNSDSAAIRYKIGENHLKQYVKGTWAKTFECDSGLLMLTVTSWSNPMNCGVSVDGVAVDVGYHTDFFECWYYLE